MTTPDDYTAQLLTSLQAWRQYLEQATGSSLPGLPSPAAPQPPDVGADRRPTAAAVRESDPGRSPLHTSDRAQPATTSGTCGSAFSWAGSVPAPDLPAPATQRSLYTSFTESRSTAAEDHAWRPQRVPPPPPAAGPPGDAEFEFIGQCNPLI